MTVFISFVFSNTKWKCWNTIKQAWTHLIDSYPDLEFQCTLYCKHASHSPKLLPFCLCPEREENSYSVSHQRLHALAFHLPRLPLFYIVILFDMCLLLHSAMPSLIVSTPFFCVSCVQRALYTECSCHYPLQGKLLQHNIYLTWKRLESSILYTV